MPKIVAKYVGLKDQETDCVAGTGLKWIGKGAEHEVSEKAAAVMAKHPDVWELRTEEDAPVTQPPETASLADAKPNKGKKG